MEAPMTLLPDIESAIWRELLACTHDKAHAWRTPVLATTDSAGDAQARVVVLREVDPGARRLRFFTDSRSPKLAQIQARPHGVLVLWSPALRWQVRLAVTLATRTSGSELASAWQRMRTSHAANDYLARLPPGSALDPGASAVLDAADASAGERGHLAFVDACVQVIDWLELGDEAPRRARFGSDRSACWVQP
jgi:hypothetical protein